MSEASTNKSTTPTMASKSLNVVMAIAIGVIVANLYYLQPLLHQVTHDFRIGESSATLLLTLVQAGYAVGLALVVPLGDLHARRRLSVFIFALAAVVAVTSTLVHSFILFAVVTFLFGLTSVGGQVLIALGAETAAPAQRGRVVARLMTGLLIGILLSRSVSGLIAEFAGWRAVYLTASVALAAMAIVLSRVLPDEPPRPPVPYGRLLAGTLSLFVTLPLLRRRALFGGLIFAAFSALWTTLAFHLSAPPFHYNNLSIGLFGLFGLAGVLAANFAGHHADRQQTHVATIVAGILITLSFVVMYFGQHTLLVLALGIVMLDAGMQGLQIINQSIIYSLVPTSSSRVNSSYMVCAFAGAALGSFAAGQCYAHALWRGNCLLGGGIGVVIVLLALFSPKPSRTV